MTLKRITVRVSPELHAQASQTAAQCRVSLNQLVIEALQAYIRRREGEAGRWPLRELSALLAPAAEASDLTEQELLRQVRQVRRRIWQERYQATAQAMETETQ